MIKKHLDAIDILTELDLLDPLEYRTALRDIRTHLDGLREAFSLIETAWQVDDKGGTDFRPIVGAVRDVFDGRDGVLVALIPPTPLVKS